MTPIASGLPYFFVRGAPPGNLGYFLDGVATIAEEAVSSARELFGLVADDRARVLDHTFGPSAMNGLSCDAANTAGSTRSNLA